TFSTAPSRSVRSTSRRANRSLTASCCSSSRSRRKPPQTCHGPSALPKGRAPRSFVSNYPKAGTPRSPCCPPAKKYFSYPQGSRRCDNHPPGLLWGKCPGPSVPIRLCHGGGSVLLRCCERVGPFGIPWVSLGYPLGIPWVFYVAAVARRRLGWATGPCLSGTTTSSRLGMSRQPLTCCCMRIMTREPGGGTPCLS